MHSDNLAGVTYAFQLVEKLPRFVWFVTVLSILARMNGVPSTWPLLQENTAKDSSQSDIIIYPHEERERKPQYAKRYLSLCLHSVYKNRFNVGRATKRYRNKKYWHKEIILP